MAPPCTNELLVHDIVDLVLTQSFEQVIGWCWNWAITAAANVSALLCNMCKILLALDPLVPSAPSGT